MKSKKNQKREDLSKELSNCLEILNNFTTWMKAQIIKYSVNCYISKQIVKVKEQQNKKPDSLIVEKNIQNGLQNNPNNLIRKLNGKTLSKQKLKY